MKAVAFYVPSPSFTLRSATARLEGLSGLVLNASFSHCQQWLRIPSSASSLFDLRTLFNLQTFL